MKELNFATGLEEFSLNGKCSVFFNPTDISIAERLFKTFDSLDKQQAVYEERIKKTAKRAEIFDIGRELDAEMREKCNSIFDTDICTPVVGSMNICALADGLPAWANLLLAIMDEMDSAYAREQKATNPRIQKYTQKYQKYMK